MNLNNFTIKSQEAVQKAVELVRMQNRQSIEATDLLKAVILTGESMMQFLFQKLGIHAAGLNQLLDRKLGSYPKVTGGEPYLSREANAVLQKAIDYCGKMGDQYVSLEHIVLALLTEQSDASQMLKDAGMTEKELRAAIESIGRRHLRFAEQIRHQPQRTGTVGQARSGDRARRRDSPRVTDTKSPNQKQSDSDR